MPGLVVGGRERTFFCETLQSMFQKNEDVKEYFSGNESFIFGRVFSHLQNDWLGVVVVVVVDLLSRPQQRARRGRIIWTDEESKGAAQVILSSDWSSVTILSCDWPSPRTAASRGWPRCSCGRARARRTSCAPPPSSPPGYSCPPHTASTTGHLGIF